MKKKKFYLFAGVNGAGKSTLYNLDIIKNKYTGKRINTDEIVREIGEWNSPKYQMTAGRIAIQMRNECIKNGETFNQETTLSGKSILKTIDILKEQGYEINLYYVGVENSEIAKSRVKNRVEKGGHDIPENVIEKRYSESLENLKKIMSKCDSVVLFDNSKFYEKCLSKKDDKIEIYNDTAKWVKDVILSLENKENNNSIQCSNKIKISTVASDSKNNSKIKIKAKNFSSKKSNDNDNEL